ncbi:uncharacterized protein TM35_000072540 [Trypanosoma theileri]|uniref:Uncharacterized protein n=1 Tax=Trypanosoma theileri TaxID=67003 RepID=A0A1X0P352_9TRYP|nr:uncharacterized protein TM35_000072540 [Trypanosoma theileri]ORC90830.1 hypothetical protein TM35_000072540 [Trypanosoma theileri]
MKSRIGRPDMNELLDADLQLVSPVGSRVAGGSGSDSSAVDGDHESSSDESEWGTVGGNFRIEDVMKGESDVDMTAEEDKTEEKLLYVPEPVISLSCVRKPLVPRLPIEDLPVGTNVWVVDEEDVQLLLREHWDESYRAVCNGRISGTVVRHSNNVTLVRFYNEQLDMDYSLSLPRACLSDVPIDAYSSSPHGSSYMVTSFFGLGNLGPRAGRSHDNTTTCTLDKQYYESLSFMEVHISPNLPQLGVANERFIAGAYEDAISLLDKLDDETQHKMVDVLVLRSRTNIFLGRYEEALKDALKIIELDPSWVKGYVAAARALSGLGNFEEAGTQINQAMLLLPHSRELRRIGELDIFLCNLEMSLPKNELKLSLDAYYAKQLLTCRQYKKFDTIYDENWILLAMESIVSEPSERCCVCLKPSKEMMRVPIDLIGNASVKLACYCSVECQQRSSLFFAMELGRHRLAVERARDLISSTFTLRVCQTPLDLAYMTTRLFAMICVTHDRLSVQRRCHRRANESGNSKISFEEGSQSFNSERDSVVPLQTALKHLGVYPLVTDRLSGRGREEMRVVYDTFTAFFTEEEKQMYSLTLFYALYEYVRTFAICLSGRKKDNKMYFLPKLVGAVRRVAPNQANCTVVLCEDGGEAPHIKLVASRDIASGEMLSIPALDMSSF